MDLSTINGTTTSGVTTTPGPRRPEGHDDSGAVEGRRRPPKPDPDQPLVERGIDITQLSSVAELLGTDAESLTEQFGEDLTLRDLVTAGSEAGATKHDVLSAVASDLGLPDRPPRFGHGGSGGPGGGTPGLLFDSSSDQSSLPNLLSGDEDS